MSTVVLYIAGTGRSGSTVLANILGEVDGVFAAGEVRYLWQRGLKEGRLCGCGLPVRECPVWSKVLALAGELDDPARVDGIVSMLQRTGRIRNLPGVLAGSAWYRASIRPSRTRSTPARDALRRSLRGDRDGHRLPGDRRTRRSFPRTQTSSRRRPASISVSFTSSATLGVRRTRGRARRRLPTAPRGRTWSRSVRRRARVLWDVWNIAGGVLFKGGPDRYLRLRYEDFVADPPATVRALLRDGRDGGAPSCRSSTAMRRTRHRTTASPAIPIACATVRSPCAAMIAGRAPWHHGTGGWSACSPRRCSSATDIHFARRRASPVPTRPSSTGRLPVRAPRRDLARRVRRHLRWGRTEGFSRLVEEDELNPLTRARVAASKWEWRRAHPRAGRAGEARLPRRTAAVRHQHACARPRHRTRVRGAQRERQRGLRPLPAQG